jgi:hypothetical protein
VTYRSFLAGPIMLYAALGRVHIRGDLDQFGMGSLSPERSLHEEATVEARESARSRCPDSLRRQVF